MLSCIVVVSKCHSPLLTPQDSEEPGEVSTPSSEASSGRKPRAPLRRVTGKQSPKPVTSIRLDCFFPVFLDPYASAPQPIHFCIEVSSDDLDTQIDADMMNLVHGLLTTADETGPKHKATEELCGHFV